MAAESSALFRWFLWFFSIVMLVSAAESGLNVTLPCRAPNNNILISVVEWSRPDLKRDEYVILYRDNQLHPDYQDPSFKGRVDLQDNQMKDGDVSLVLKDVTISDAGTYECRIIQRTGTTRMKRTWLTTDPINIINLSVVPSDPPGGHREDRWEADGSVGLIVENFKGNRITAQQQQQDEVQASWCRFQC
ncbi:programmed cell death 1 ligand 1-like [Astatotilapia calliptera]|uniref:programmed cell death 1 ligand 1-like n=1 Tax=Astatotilapia calliptera TaxID=8154 RepID=UPI000E4294A1|nr:programmed cell death 1 ligand 1-like [Astatotilapia calliptera]